MQSIAGALLGSKIEGATKPLDQALDAFDEATGAKAPEKEQTQSSSMIPAAFMTSDMKVKAKLDARKKDREAVAQKARAEYEQKLGVDFSQKAKEGSKEGGEGGGMWESTTGAMTGAFGAVTGTTKKISGAVTGTVSSMTSTVMGRGQQDGKQEERQEEGPGHRAAEDSPPDVQEESTAGRMLKSVQGSVKGGLGVVATGAGKLQSGLTSGTNVMMGSVKSGGSKLTSLFGGGAKKPEDA